MKKIEEDEKMRDVFMELLKPQIDNIRRNDLYDYVKKGGMTVDFAAQEAGVSVDQFRKQMEEHDRSQNLQPV